MSSWRRFKRVIVKSISFRQAIWLCLASGLPAIVMLWWNLPGGFVFLVFNLLLFQVLVFLGLSQVTRRNEANSWMLYRALEALSQMNQIIQPRLPLPPMRHGAASPDVLVLLCKEILKSKPLTLVECGAGVSTLVIGYLIEKLGRGRLITLEHDSFWAERVTRWVHEHQLSHVVQIVHAPLTSQTMQGKTFTWYDATSVQTVLRQELSVDFLFVDGPPGNLDDSAREPALIVLRDLLSPLCVMVLDDTHRPGEERTARSWAQTLHYQAEWIDNEKGAAVLRPSHEQMDIGQM